MVRMVDENPWTSDALIPNMGMSKTRNINTSRRAANDTLDIKIPVQNTIVNGAVEKLKMPSLASLISLRSGYLVEPAARACRS